ncbi:Protein CBG04563 [Caenorhabditis briggsae]|uniref:Protein CBG04563 n=1 Tax=Caenorhabditis briggsae TaxID=6238 RepID=A8WXX9_CAEBR|nr:Protein CBG04563 [Caenorhabditis briggsae]CAP25239.2 Protein CBG04563 [Caenorhabditis briggsae]
MFDAVNFWSWTAIGVVWTIAFYRWLGIHGQKMTRNEIVFFEAANLLEVDPPVFRFGLPEIADDCLTPGDGEQREHPQPQTLWDALFTDEKKIRMDRFYKKHYGSVHATASKALMEYELEQAKEKEKLLKKVPPPLPTTSTSKSL